MENPLKINVRNKNYFKKNLFSDHPPNFPNDIRRVFGVVILNRSHHPIAAGESLKHF